MGIDGREGIFGKLGEGGIEGNFGFGIFGMDGTFGSWTRWRPAWPTSKLPNNDKEIMVKVKRMLGLEYAMIILP